jgi:hypothetical protein
MIICLFLLTFFLDDSLHEPFVVGNMGINPDANTPAHSLHDLTESRFGSASSQPVLHGFASSSAGVTPHQPRGAPSTAASPGTGSTSLSRTVVADNLSPSKVSRPTRYPEGMLSSAGSDPERSRYGSPVQLGSSAPAPPADETTLVQCVRTRSQSGIVQSKDLPGGFIR